MHICASANTSYLYCYNSSQLAQHLRPSGILGCWPDGLELSRILSGMQQAAQTVLGIYLKHTCSRNTSASSALGVLCMYDTYVRVFVYAPSPVGLPLTFNLCFFICFHGVIIHVKSVDCHCCVILVWTSSINAFDFLSSSPAWCQLARGCTLQVIWVCYLYFVRFIHIYLVFIRYLIISMLHCLKPALKHCSSSTVIVCKIISFPVPVS